MRVEFEVDQEGWVDVDSGEYEYDGDVGLLKETLETVDQWTDVHTQGPEFGLDEGPGKVFEPMDIRQRAEIVESQVRSLGGEIIEVEKSKPQIIEFEDRRYIDDPSEAPDDVQVQEGPQGGLYYSPSGDEETGESDGSEEFERPDSIEDLDRVPDSEKLVRPPFPESEGEHRKWLTSEDREDAVTREVELSDLIDTQGFALGTDIEELVEAYEQGEDIGAIEVTEEDGDLFIFDGHHRATAAVIAGQDKIRAQVVPIDDEDEDEKMEKIAYHLWDNTPELSDEDDFEVLEEYLYEAYEQQIHPWDLTKAPRMWSSDDEVPDFVEGWIEDVIEMMDPMWDQFDDVPHAAALRVQEIVGDSLTQPQGWSTASIASKLEDEFEGIDRSRAEVIARQEVAAILNKSREVAYRARSDFDQTVFDWIGPDDQHTTEICTEIKEEIKDRGGAVTMDQLKDILRSKSRQYKEEGGTPARVDSLVPHYQCRHTIVERDIEDVR